jgi:hypothetical protein
MPGARADPPWDHRAYSKLPGIYTIVLWGDMPVGRSSHRVLPLSKQTGSSTVESPSGRSHVSARRPNVCQRRRQRAWVAKPRTQAPSWLGGGDCSAESTGPGRNRSQQPGLETSEQAGRRPKQVSRDCKGEG